MLLGAGAYENAAECKQSEREKERHEKYKTQSAVPVIMRYHFSFVHANLLYIHFKAVNLFLFYTVTKSARYTFFRLFRILYAHVKTAPFESEYVTQRTHTRSQCLYNIFHCVKIKLPSRI